MDALAVPLNPMEDLGDDEHLDPPGRAGHTGRSYLSLLLLQRRTDCLCEFEEILFLSCLVRLSLTAYVCPQEGNLQVLAGGETRGVD